MYTNVRDFGAVGDGAAKDTQAIQRALDHGGIVHFPPGRYLTGTIHLKSHGGIRLDAGAVLLASPDAADYNADDFCVQNRVLRQELVSGRHLIAAVEQEHITICGEGRVDGNFGAWLNEPDPTLGVTPPFYKRDPERPGQMVYLCECSNVRIRDVEMTNASYWHCFLHGCENVTISGVHIHADPKVMNNDGIDLDCCRRVTVSDCVIETADDALTLRADFEPLKKPRSCEHITVTNCVFSSDFANGIRIGVGNGEVKNCLFNNIVIHNSRTGVCIVSRYWQPDRGAAISNLDFSNLQLHVARPFCVKLDDRSDLAPTCARSIRNIRFSNISGTARLSSYLTGSPTGALSGIRFHNVDLQYSGIGPAPDRNEHGHWGYSSTDAAFELKHVTDTTFRDVEIRYDENASGWNHDLTTHHCRGVRADNCRFDKGVSEG